MICSEKIQKFLKLNLSANEIDSFTEKVKSTIEWLEPLAETNEEGIVNSKPFFESSAKVLTMKDLEAHGNIEADKVKMSGNQNSFQVPKVID